MRERNTDTENWDVEKQNVVELDKDGREMKPKRKDYVKLDDKIAEKLSVQKFAVIDGVVEEVPLPKPAADGETGSTK